MHSSILIFTITVNHDQFYVYPEACYRVEGYIRMATAVKLTLQGEISELINREVATADETLKTKINQTIMIICFN